MLTPTEAEALILASIPRMPSEDVPLAEAHGRVLRANVRADRDLPPFDRVMLDGYALPAAAWAAGARTFRVAGLQAAGMIPQTLTAGDACIEIATGAALPEGTDCVVPYEETTRDGEIVKNFRTGQNSRPATPCAPPRQRLRGGHGRHPRPPAHASPAARVAVAAACGRTTLIVSARPKIAVIATGDELVDVGADVGPHQIRRSNDYALRAALHAAGWPRVERFHLHDMRHEIEHTLWHILAEFDVVLLAGGVSKGKFDFLPAVLAELGVQKKFLGVAQRPGKPLWFGLSQRARARLRAAEAIPYRATPACRAMCCPRLRRAAGLPPIHPDAWPRSPRPWPSSRRSRIFSR